MIFKDYANNVNGGFNSRSQNGEDKIIKTILDFIRPNNKLVIEFGAADGFFCSNVAYYWSELQWRGLLIESNLEHYEKLLSTVEHLNHVVAYNEEVANIDDYIVEEADILSIDVDGLDFDIWDRSNIRHRIVVIEYNPTFPIHIEYHGGNWQGSSARSLLRLATDKDYTLAAMTRTNMIFVRNEDAEFLNDFDTSLESNFSTQDITYIVSDYQGNFDIVGKPPYDMVHRVKMGWYDTSKI